jgi:transcriptional regulator with XRE-family HTH domain
VINLNKSEKRVICIEFADYVPKIREILHLTQQEFGARCGISTDRLSRIENEHAVMTWSQYTSILFLCMTNLDTKEFIFANSILKPEVLQYFQLKDENIPPVINICVHSEIEKAYTERHRDNQ